VTAGATLPAMIRALLTSTGGAATAVALAFMGCVTALAITGHITGSEALVAFGIVGGGGTAVGAAHVTGSVVSAAASSAVTPAAPAPAPSLGPPAAPPAA
jgi:hypothetical protein